MSKIDYERLCAALAERLHEYVEREDQYQEALSSLNEDLITANEDWAAEHKRVEELELGIRGAELARDEALRPYIPDPKMEATINGLERERKVQNLAEAMAFLVEGGR